MATKAWIAKTNRVPKFKVRAYTRCQLCGRRRAVYRKFRVCRICFRSLAHQGKIPGVRKASGNVGYKQKILILGAGDVE